MQLHRLRFALPIAGLAAAVAAQPPTRAELEQRRDAVLAADWIRAAPWTTDYDAARAAAAESKRMILAYFTRSYAP